MRVCLCNEYMEQIQAEALSKNVMLLLRHFGKWLKSVSLVCMAFEGQVVSFHLE